MMNTKTFTSVNRVIYDDNYSLKQQQKSSFINQFLKGLLSAITLLFFILLLIFAENTLFGLGFGDENKSMMISKSLNAFFDLHSPKYLQLNFLIVFRFFILSFTLFYALIKNFTNLYWHRATIKKYLPWFVLYLVIATISFLLFFTFFSVWPKEVFNLVFLLLVLFLLNLSYEIFNYFISKKTIKSVITENLLDIGFTWTIIYNDQTKTYIRPTDFMTKNFIDYKKNENKIATRSKILYDMIVKNESLNINHSEYESLLVNNEWKRYYENMINIFLYQYYNEGIKIDIDFLNHFLLKDALK